MPIGNTYDLYKYKYLIIKYNYYSQNLMQNLKLST